MAAHKTGLETAALRRRLNLPLLVLYGIGVTVGAGIYVLVGTIAGHAGTFAPISFVFAAIVMGLTVGSYAELCTRFPVAAGEAAYIRAAFNSRILSTITGSLMIGAGVIAAATVSVGSAGYIAQFVDLPRPVLIGVVVLALSLVTAWGVLESVLLASLFTLIEVGGLLTIIAAATRAGLPFETAMLAWPSASSGLWLGIAYSSLLAFFAFTGFENLTNMVEEAHAPERDVPIAMAITLVVTTGLYVTIAAISVTAVSPEALASTAAPLSLVYREVAHVSPTVISMIAIVATLNTIIAQMTMATRVIYGMSRQGDLPGVFGTVNRATATPILATAGVALVVYALACLVSFERLAEFTSLATLLVFALVNLSLLVIRRRSPGRAVVRVPIIVPILGFLCCIGMIASALFY